MARFADARVVHGDDEERVVGEWGSALEDGLKQILGLPGGAAVEFVVGAPVAVLAAEGEQGAGQSATAESEECGDGLVDGASAGAGLSEGRDPGVEDVEECEEQSGRHVSSLHVKHNKDKKKRSHSRLRTQQRLIKLADLFDLVFQQVVIGEPLFNERFLLRAEADMADLAAGFADSEDEDGMALAAVALRATGLMANGTLEQGAAQQLGSREVGSQFVAPTDDVLVFHLL
jgi:hypothetical protein